MVSVTTWFVVVVAFMLPWVKAGVTWFALATEGESSKKSDIHKVFILLSFWVGLPLDN